MIISRYLIKEIASTIFAVTLVLLLIFMCNQVVRYLGYAASGKIGANILVQLIGFEIPNLLALLLPLGVFLGIIFAYSKLYAENEMRVMHLSGLSVQRLVRMTGFAAFFVSVLVMILTCWINPYVAAARDKLILQSVSIENLMNTLVAGRFQVIGGKDAQRVIYVEHVTRNHHEASHLFFADQHINKKGQTNWSVISADKGYPLRDIKTNSHYVVTTDGFRYEGTPGQNNYKIIQFDKYAVRIPDHVNTLNTQQFDVMPTFLLWQHYYQNKENAAELQWRLSIPLSAFLLAMLAIPLSKTRPRQGRYTHLLPAILIYVIYINLLFVARDWMQTTKWIGHFGLWWVHAGLILMIGFAFLLQSSWVQMMRRSI